MCLAQHLAILYIRAAAFAPSRYVVGIHLFQLPNAQTVGIMTDGKKKAKRFSGTEKNALLCSAKKKFLAIQ